MRGSESFAAAAVAAVCSARVTFRESQAHGEHDFDLELPDGQRGILEVASVVDPTLLRSYAAIVDTTKGSQRVSRAACERGWIITPYATSDIRRLRSSVDRYLAAMERAGIDRFHGLSFASNPAVRAIHDDLGVKAAACTNDLACHWLMLPGIGTGLRLEAVNEAVVEAAGRPDNLTKLSACDVSQRHLFVYVDSTAFSAWVPLFEGEDVASPVQVAPSITHLWVGTHRGPDAGVVWHARNAGQWTLYSLARSTAPELEGPWEVTSPA